jgi:hypothetical protein
MRKLLPAVLLFVALPALADMVVKRQWGVATTVGFTMPDYSDPIDLVTNADVTFATGDVKYSCDEGAQANIGSLPTEEGTVQFAQALTAAEMRCARVHLLYIDTATKVWADWGIIIETYGCHTATDFTATIRCGTAVDGDTQEITLDASASSTTDAYVGHPIRIIAGTGAGQGDRTGTAYNGTSKVLTVNAAWHTVPDNTSVFQIDSDKEPIITADANGVVSANVVQLDGDAGAAAVQEAFFDGSTQALTNVTIGTVTTLTGHTAQTGDSYALIGTPSNLGSGATLAANLVDIEGYADNLPTDPADDSDIDGQLTQLLAARTQLLVGTADGGDTNTLVDAALGVAFTNDADIDGAYVVRSDGQRCFVDSYTAATDTIEFLCSFTGVWSTQDYKLYPANEQP